MKNKYPFIKKFKTDNCNYVYDVNSNEIIRVDPLIYDIIDFINEEDVNFIIDKFNKMKKF